MTDFEFARELLFAGQDRSIFGSEELIVFAKYGVADNGFIFIRAEDNAEGGIVILASFEIIKHTDIHIHLADILVGEFVDLQVNEYEAL